MRGLPVCLVLGSFLLIPVGLGVHPLDDDAGSGGDAPDSALLALPLVSGTYAGHLTSGIDRVDWYRFDALPGDLIHVGVDDSAFGLFATAFLYNETEAMNPAGQGSEGPFLPIVHLVEESGTYYLRIEMGANDLAGRIPYELVLSLRQGTIWASGEPDAKGFVQELRVDAPTDLFLRLKLLGKANDFTGPASMTILHDHQMRGDGWSSAGGGGVRSYGGSLSEWFEPFPLDEPVDEVPFSVEGLHGGVFSTYFPSNVTGHIRMVGWAVQHNITLTYQLWANRSVEYAHAAIDDVIEWATEDSVEEDDLRTPVLTRVGPRNLSFETNGRFAGMFVPKGEQDAWATGPDGTVYEPYKRSSIMFYWPEPGAWRLDLGTTVGTGTESEWLWFDGVHVPDLGVAPDPVMRFPSAS